MDMIIKKCLNVLSQIKNKKLNIKKDLEKYYNEMDPNYGQTQISLSQKIFIKFHMKVFVY